MVSVRTHKQAITYLKGMEGKLGILIEVLVSSALM